MNTTLSNNMEITAYLSTRKVLIDKHLEKILDSGPTNHQLMKLLDSMSYTLIGNGKRMRPIITIAVYELFDKNIEEVIDPACAIELIHSASLVLDDLPCMDNAEYRRGKKANHIVYGEGTAILASAALWVAAFKIFSKIQSVEINSIVRETADSVGHTGLIKGQFIDIESFKKPQTLEELQDCYYLKTGILFQNAAKIGALMGRATKEQGAILEKFGRDFGLAYQVRDDILDVESTLEKTGKDVKIDAKNGKATYVSLLGIKGAKKTLSNMIEKICKDLKHLELDVDQLVKITQNLKLK